MADSRKIANSLRVAKMYYYHGMTTDAIARELTMSRSAVSRLLSFAKREGYVEIRINDPHNHPGMLEEKVQSIAQLERVQVVPMVSMVSDSEKLERVAQYTANYLSNIFSSGLILGVAWGTTTAAISRHLVPKTTHQSQIIQLNGAGNLESSGIEYASEIIMRFAHNFRASYHLFPVPAFFDKAQTRRAMWQETSIKKLLDIQDQADLLLYSIGAVDAGIPSHLHTEGYLRPSDYTDLKRWGVVGDIATTFFREDGQDNGVLINQRSSGPSLDFIRKKRGICVVSGLAKLRGLQAAVQGRLLRELIIDEPTARAFVERYGKM
ncbi:MAG: hypothetical protein BGO78_02820 [Chloroflexi bacterium 44-23]|nr:MAG: hypothetical protein BGO78_02820 [Chloroflexi bacterium 44-23]